MGKSKVPQSLPLENQMSIPTSESSMRTLIPTHTTQHEQVELLNNIINILQVPTL